MKIQFVKNLNNCILPEIPTDTYVIYKEGYDVPDIEKVDGKIEFEEFRNIYPNIHANMFIFFGFNRIMNPSNRTDFIFEYLFMMSTDIKKISVDYDPFIGEPWRLWFHYGLCNCGKFGVPYSYAYETEWKHWFYRKINDSRFESNNLEICITDTYSNLDYLKYNSKFYDPTNDDFKWYKEAKEFVFNKYDTPKLLINNLLKLANKRFKLDLDYDSYRKVKKEKQVGFLNKEENKKEFLLPDLGVYKFIDEENKRRLGIYNKVIEVGKNEDI